MNQQLLHVRGNDGLMCVNTSVLIGTVPLDLHVNVNEMNVTRS